MGKERLDKVVVSHGKHTRSQVKALCRAGQVLVNGETVKDSSVKVDPDNDQICVAGQALAQSSYIYLMMNKPAGIVSASRDPKEKTVIDLVPASLYRRGLFPAGRLDKDTVGFVLITNDGQFAHRMLSPRHHVPKTYEALVTGHPDEKTIEAFEKGMDLGQGEVCMPAQLRILEPGDPAKVEVVLREGMYHQIKRMFQRCGCQVVFLKRTKIGELPLDPELKPGDCREILHKEKNQIL